MTIISSAQVQQIMTQINSGSFGGSSGGGSGFNIGDLLADPSLYEGMGSDNKDTQRRAVGQYIMQMISKMGNGICSMFGGGIKESAEEAVDQSSKVINDGEEKSKEIVNNAETTIEAALATAQGNLENIDAALADLEELEGEHSELQEKLEAKKREIENAMTIINDPDKTETEKKGAIAKIDMAQEEIGELLKGVADLKPKIDEGNEDVETNQGNVEAITEDIDETQEKTQGDLAFVQNNTRTLIVANQTFETTGEVMTTVGQEIEVAAETAGAAEVVSPVAGAVADQMKDMARDMQDGGDVLTTGGGENITLANTTLTGINTGIGTIDSYTSTVGSYNSDLSNFTGSFYQESEDLLASCDNWTPVEEAKDELEEQVEEYQTNPDEEFEFDAEKLKIEVA